MLKFLVIGKGPQCLINRKMTTVSYLVKQALVALASPELGTAQPQLVFITFNIFCFTMYYNVFRLQNT